MKRFPVLALSLVLGLSAAAHAQVARNAEVNQQILSNLQQKFSGNKNLSGVHAKVDDQVVTLTGTVPDYRAKLNAYDDAAQLQNVNGVVNRITVGGPTVPDDQLKKTLADRLAYDRMWMGQTFNALTVNVHNGVVTVGGEVRDYPDRDSALDIVEDTKGVKGVIDNVKVAPLSPMDDQIRLEAARRIYGNPTLEQYANNPARPIRILVNDGHVTLVGVVNSQVDKQIAGNAVRTLPGVFSVQNDLQVAH